jgi:uncharacterized protein
MSPANLADPADAAGPRGDPDVRDVAEASRYEARLPPNGDADGAAAIAFAAYLRHGREIVFTHTEVPPALEGRGVGSRLARAALDDARRHGLTVIPRCPFIAAFIRRHPEYRDLVPEARRDALLGSRR